MYKAGSLRAGLPSLILIDMATIFSKIITGEIPSYKVAVIGLEVPHAHIHLIPIQKESDMIFSNPKLKLANEEFVEIARTINEAWEGLK